MKCNKPRRTPDGPKKFVVKACEDGKEKDHPLWRSEHADQEIKS